MSAELPVYEVRRGWTSRNVSAAVFAGLLDAALVALIVVTHDWFGLPLLVFFTYGLVRTVSVGIRKPVVLRADERGIALIKSFRRKPKIFVPWSELDQVWVIAWTRSVDAVGLSTTSAPRKPRYTFAMFDWSADFDRLAELMARYAPTATFSHQPSHYAGGGDEGKKSDPFSMWS